MQLAASKEQKDFMKLDIVVAHDYLTQRGGAERVVIELANALEPRCLVTAIYSPDTAFPDFRAIKVQATILSKIKIFRKDSRLALPVLAPIWSTIKPITADCVVCSSSGWSHGLPITKGTKKVVYCHNPARWLYQTEDYLIERPWYIRLALHALRPLLISWDRRAAAKVDLYIANSTSVAERIRTIYGREATVVFPPVSVNTSLPTEPIKHLIGEKFFLMVGRPRGYKGAQSLIDAFRLMPEHKLVIAGGAKVANPPNNVDLVGYVKEAELRWLYENARALISVSREDFGLTPIEANAFGTPVLLLKAGGFLDSTAEGTSGFFIDDDTPEAICAAVRNYPTNWDKAAIKSHADRFNASRFQETIRNIVLEVCK